ncbi:TIM barrel protein [Streptomyces coffeae]|uniref:TIM barrel protein n=1 Tax=Streptomyces coffeae TaxID=621382 RepID=A0ABS1NR58_9ACTN|nr:TIM barrel protein [Streptomyces coffeae]MBL1102597.1 TIM barrel protein [Streptomyces coffeae]
MSPRTRVGSAPDSWGVWFPDDPQQTDWTRFLDELAFAGYTWLELGPYGFLPADPQVLREELGRRNLKLSGGTVGGPLHRREAHAAIRDDLLRVGRLAASQEAQYVVFLPAMYRDLHSGVQLEPSELDADGWRSLVEGATELARVLYEETGTRFVFHPHAESHVETDEQVASFLADTAPSLVGLCLDTGHVAYRRGDTRRLMLEHSDRIWYVHLKQVDPQVLDRVDGEALPFAEAVKLGVMCEPPFGVPTLQEVSDGLAQLFDDTFVIVEQDMYPCSPDYPLPIAARTRSALRDAAIG